MGGRSMKISERIKEDIIRDYYQRMEDVRLKAKALDTVEEIEQDLKKDFNATLLSHLRSSQTAASILITPGENQGLEDILKILVQYSEPYRINSMNRENGEQKIWMIVCREDIRIEIRWKNSCQMIQTGIREEPVYEFICDDEEKK